jgi:hypothetical protein
MWKVLMVLMVLSFAAVAPAEAQDCTVKCSCTGAGCGCQSSGGNGCKCDASGGGCFVTQCGSQSCNITEEASVLIAFAPDGTPVRSSMPATLRARRAALLVTQVNRVLAAGEDRYNGWLSVEQGHSVQRDCAGVVVRRAYSSTRIAAIRASTSQITL